MSKLNENIRKFRELRRLTQKDFSDRLKKSRNVISNWERGENAPDPDTIEQICRILDVTPNQLFGWEACPDYEDYMERVRAVRLKMDELVDRKKAIDKEIDEIKALIRSERAKDGNGKI